MQEGYAAATRPENFSIDQMERSGNHTTHRDQQVANIRGTVTANPPFVDPTDARKGHEDSEQSSLAVLFEEEKTRENTRPINRESGQ